MMVVHWNWKGVIAFIRGFLSGCRPDLLFSSRDRNFKHVIYFLLLLLLLLILFLFFILLFCGQKRGVVRGKGNQIKRGNIKGGKMNEWGLGGN